MLSNPKIREHQQFKLLQVAWSKKWKWNKFHFICLTPNNNYFKDNKHSFSWEIPAQLAIKIPHDLNNYTSSTL